MQKYNNIYFLGIGGIGMSALAHFFANTNYKVGGYDKTPSEITAKLIKNDIFIHFEEDINDIPKEFLDSKNTLIVYTPAIPKEHKEFVFFQENGFTIFKRSQVLGMLTENHFTIAVAGTHGKTTTSAMIAHLLTHAQKNVMAFVGGIMNNYNTNILLADTTKPMIVVVEADEYDRSFLTLSPDIAIVNSADADHLDIYGDGSAVTQSFEDFIGKIKENGKLFIKKDINLNIKNKNNIIIKEFSLENTLENKVSVRNFPNNFFTENFHIKEGKFCFDIRTPTQLISGVEMRMAGFHNVLNALAACAAAEAIDISGEMIKSGLNSFTGVHRRFEYLVNQEDTNKNIIFIDDYAHHPEEIKALLTSVRALYPNKKITTIFQPHLYSRTRDFVDGFAESLSLADEVWLTDIYPARELPIEGVTSNIILEKMYLKNKFLYTTQQILEKISNLETDILLTVGAGDIELLAKDIQKKIIN
jgi:UDP-N-acetylmuramate--alanine ligase